MTSISVRRWLPVFLFFGGSFLLHLLWENLQAPLYAEFASFRDHFWVCFKATWGDLLFMFTIYAALAVVHRNLFWIADRSSCTHPATWIIAPLIGLLLAVSFELWAVYVDHRWQYTGMPMIPVLRVGLMPVLQMIVIPTAAIAIPARFLPQY